MFRRRLDLFFKDPMWLSLTSFCLILFFVFLGDGILSFWVPNLIQESLNGNSFLMGLILSFSSVVGLIADLAFPQLLRGLSVRKLISFGIISSFVFIISLYIGAVLPGVLIFLIAMSIWGIYYELLGFATQQFIADSVPQRLHSSGWAFLGIFKNLAYFIGPLIAGLLVLRSGKETLLSAAIFVIIGFLIFHFSRKKHERAVTIEIKEVNLWRELTHWKVLFKSVWTILTLSLFMGLIDATFWTTGAVWTEKLAGISFWGAMLLPAYQLPSFLAGFFVSKWGIFHGKKRKAEELFLISGLILSMMFFELPVVGYILVVFASSLVLAVAYPLVDATYSDVISRMGVERKHLVGLSSSTVSMAYIIGPTLAGLFTSIVGEKMTFGIIGVITVFISLILLIFTPKKLHLPENEIKTWED